MDRYRKVIGVFATAFFLCAVVFLFPRTRVHAASEREILPVLELNKLAEFSAPSGASYLEGGTAASSGYMVAFLSSTAGKPNPVQVIDTNTWTAVKAGSAELSHANDMCYVPQRREIYVTPMDRAELIVLEESTLNVKSKIKTLRNYHAIGYDTASDRFAAVFVTGSGAARRLYCDILDGTCQKVLGTFSADTNLTYQGLTVHDSLIYYTSWERGGVNSLYEPVYDGIFQKSDNVIYVYNFSGQLVKRLLVMMPEGYSKFELETASFIGNRMILQFNETLDDASGTRMIGIYEVTAEGLSLAQKAEKEAAEKKAEQEKKALQKLTSRKTAITGITRRKKSLKVRWKKLSAGSVAAEGYEIQLCRKKNFRGRSLKGLVRSGNVCVFRGLKRRTTYYIRVRAYAVRGDQTYYSAWSSKKKVRTR